MKTQIITILLLLCGTGLSQIQTYYYEYEGEPSMLYFYKSESKENFVWFKGNDKANSPSDTLYLYPCKVSVSPPADSNEQDNLIGYGVISEVNYDTKNKTNTYICNRFIIVNNSK